MITITTNGKFYSVKRLTSYYIIITVKPFLKDMSKLWTFFGNKLNPLNSGQLRKANRSQRPIFRGFIVLLLYNQFLPFLTSITTPPPPMPLYPLMVSPPLPPLYRLLVTVFVSVDSMVSTRPSLGTFFLVKFCTVLVTLGRYGSSDLDVIRTVSV